MSNRDLTLDQLAAPRRVRTRAEKLGLAISMLAFFGAIGVVGWFGLSGYQVDDGADSSAPRVIFAGGEVAPPVVDGNRRTAAEGTEDQYVVGDFGDPVAELYAEDENGGWGASALERSSASAGESDSGTRRTGRISRGTGGDNN